MDFAANFWIFFPRNLGISAEDFQKNKREDVKKILPGYHCDSLVNSQDFFLQLYAFFIEIL